MRVRLSPYICAFLFCFIVLVSSNTTHAQSASQSSATITGTVQQSDDSPVAHATVKLEGAETFTAQTNAGGLFIFTNVPYGNYRITVAIKGLGVATRDRVDVAGDTNVTVRYEPAASRGLRIIAQVATTNHNEISTQPVSVTVVTPQTLADQGEHSWQHILNEIPGVNVGNIGGGSNYLGNNAASIPDSPLYPQVLQIG